MQTKCLASVLFKTMLALVLVSSPSALAAVKDQSRITTKDAKPKETKPNNEIFPPNLLEKPPKTVPETPSSTPIGPPSTPSENDEFNIEDIPALERIELSLDIAKRAIDAFVDVGNKYDDKGLNDYPTLKEYVEKTNAGKELQKEVQGHGFKDIVEWNTAIMNVSFAYSALLEDQENDIKGQIAAIKESTSIDDAKKLRIIASLNALIPTKANVKIMYDLNKIPAYRKKLEMLNAFE